MHTNIPRTYSESSNADFLHRYARRMLRDAHSAQSSKAMPVMRRIHAAAVMPAVRLVDLFRTRQTLQLKHVLATIAIELGYANWPQCKLDIDHHLATMLDRFRVDLGAFHDYNKLWFADETTAKRWQQEHGGHLVMYGTQAVVLNV